jgi:trehalose/maltose hydrolase-like predicted phosphorylase
MVTGNIGFLRFAGAELLIEIARFWSSIATYNAELDRYEILGVMGPDEYHESYPDSDEQGLRNNTYTNVMAVWCSSARWRRWRSCRRTTGRSWPTS